MKRFTIFFFCFFLLFIVPDSEVNAQNKTPVFVIVHGAWGGSWAFKKVDSLMTAKKAIMYRPSLTGPGESVHPANTSISFQTHIQDIYMSSSFKTSGMSCSLTIVPEKLAD